ncbi:hypothetical protein [Flexithrix dorotheae]|uniref:hypothetical protein n=1 Tax=Flexithrix dorotheae TaxID=70993 RepID=UPI00036363E9|nr:hypothetical protein [Flexithrix dorotheae]
MEEFEQFLIQKKIDPILFKKGDLSTFQDFKSLFYQVHPKSFVAQKLFLINKIRRQYPFKKEIAEPEVPKKKMSRPVFKRKT